MRILMSYFAYIYVRMILWIGIKDTTAGFKCYTREALEKVNYDIIPFKGYAFQICMKYGVRKHKLGIDRKSTRLNSSHVRISYAVFCLKKKNSCGTIFPSNRKHIIIK